jgi:hypothetical protein
MMMHDGWGQGELEHACVGVEEGEIERDQGEVGDTKGMGWGNRRGRRKTGASRFSRFLGGDRYQI